MAQRMDDVIRLCCEIADQPEFKNTLENIIKVIPIAVTGFGLGGFFLGPVGFLVGGVGSTLLAWWWTSGQFKSVRQILEELPHPEKQKLHNNVVAVLGDLTWTDAAQLVSIVMSNPALQKKVTGVLLDYVKNNV